MLACLLASRQLGATSAAGQRPHWLCLHSLLPHLNAWHEQDNQRLRYEVDELNDTMFSKTFKPPSAWAGGWVLRVTVGGSGVPSGWVVGHIRTGAGRGAGANWVTRVDSGHPACLAALPAT